MIARWSEVFAVQDEITAAVTSALGPAITEAELRRSRANRRRALMPGKLTCAAYGILLRVTLRIMSVQSNSFNRPLLWMPLSAPPYAALAMAYNADGNVYGTRPPQDAVKLAATLGAQGDRD